MLPATCLRRAASSPRRIALSKTGAGGVSRIAAGSGGSVPAETRDKARALAATATAAIKNSLSVRNRLLIFTPGRVVNRSATDILGFVLIRILILILNVRLRRYEHTRRAVRHDHDKAAVGLFHDPGSVAHHANVGWRRWAELLLGAAGKAVRIRRPIGIMRLIITSGRRPIGIQGWESRPVAAGGHRRITFGSGFRLRLFRFGLIGLRGLSLSRRRCRRPDRLRRLERLRLGRSRAFRFSLCGLMSRSISEESGGAADQHQ